MPEPYLVSLALIAVALIVLAAVLFGLSRGFSKFTRVRRAVQTVWRYETGLLRARKAALRVAFDERRARRHGPGGATRPS